VSAGPTRFHVKSCWCRTDFVVVGTSPFSLGMAPWSSTNKPITESSHKQENSSQAAKHRKQPVGRRDGRYRLDIKLPVPWSIISACVQHGSKPPRPGHSRCASRGPLITRLARHACAGDPSMHHAWLAKGRTDPTCVRPCVVLVGTAVVAAR
jgi:hypothetical protein